MILECRCEDKKKKKSLSLSHCMPHFELEGLPFSPLCLLLNPPFILFLYAAIYFERNMFVRDSHVCRLNRTS